MSLSTSLIRKASNFCGQNRPSARYGPDSNLVRRSRLSVVGCGYIRSATQRAGRYSVTPSSLMGFANSTVYPHRLALRFGCWLGFDTNSLVLNHLPVQSGASCPIRHHVASAVTASAVSAYIRCDLAEVVHDDISILPAEKI